MITFKPLWKLLIDKNMSQRKFASELGISPNTMTKMRRDNKEGFISLEIVHRICDHFKIQPNEVIEYIPDDTGR